MSIVPYEEVSKFWKQIDVDRNGKQKLNTLYSLPGGQPCVLHDTELTLEPGQ